MATVTNTIKLPDGSTPSHCAVEIELVASESGAAAGWITATDVTILSKVRPTVTNGAWSASLTPNADIDPAGTVYKVTEYADKTRVVNYIEVGSGGGTVHDLLTTAPTVGDLLYENISDHAALTAAHGRVDPSMFDTLQEFFDYISDNDVGTAYIDGSWTVSTGLTIGPASGTMATNRIVGDINITASTAIDTLLTIRNATRLRIEGNLKLTGTGSTSFSSRTCRVGLHINASGRAHIESIDARNFYEWGVAVYTGNSTLGTLGDVTTYDCGSGHSSGSSTSTWSSPTNSGSSASTGQSTTLTVGTLPPAAIITDTFFVVISGKAYYVSAVDRNASTLTIYPWIDPNAGSSGTLTYLFGGGVLFDGPDVNVLGVRRLDATRCGIGLLNAGFYGPVVDRLVAQFCGAGFAFGPAPTSSSVTFQINGLYSESNTFDIIRNSRTVNGGFIASEYALTWSKVVDTCAPRATGGALSRSRTLGGDFRYSNIVSAGVVHSWVGAAENSDDAGSSFTLDITAGPPRELIYRKNSWTVNISTPSADLNRLFGYGTTRMTFIGTGSGSAPTGTFTFNPPSNFTVNGGSSASFSTFTGPVSFLVYWLVGSADILVVRQ